MINIYNKFIKLASMCLLALTMTISTSYAAAFTVPDNEAQMLASGVSKCPAVATALLGLMNDVVNGNQSESNIQGFINSQLNSCSNNDIAQEKQLARQKLNNLLQAVKKNNVDMDKAKAYRDALQTAIDKQ